MWFIGIVHYVALQAQLVLLRKRGCHQVTGLQDGVQCLNQIRFLANLPNILLLLLFLFVIPALFIASD